VVEPRAPRAVGEPASSPASRSRSRSASLRFCASRSSCALGVETQRAEVELDHRLARAHAVARPLAAAQHARLDGLDSTFSNAGTDEPGAR
jgi:hypothetical protein